MIANKKRMSRARIQYYVDIIIGVNVEADLYSKEELTSMQRIIEQIGSYQMIARSQDQIKYCNLVIRP